MNRSSARAADFVRAASLAAALIAVGSAPDLLRPALAGSAADFQPEQDAIGIVGHERLTESEVIAANQAEFDRLQSEFQLEERKLQLKFAKSRHDLLQQHLDKLLDQDALELEATARGLRPDQVLADLKVTVPTENEARAFYEANKDRIQQPYGAVASKIIEYLATQRNQTASRQFYDKLRAKRGIRSNLGPYRLSVAASGPARGQSKAPVTIVEFGDFQCPYCKQAESSLQVVLTRHPADVRLVFRNFPLTQIHPNARIAAAAGVCADRQGKFWEMHDAMYGNQHALDANSLRATAARLGLDANRFSACLDDDSTIRSLAIDAKAAEELGLTGTPYFFVNGRPIDGNVPVDEFESVIADELRQTPRNRS